MPRWKKPANVLPISIKIADNTAWRCIPALPLLPLFSDKNPAMGIVFRQGLLLFFTETGTVKFDTLFLIASCFGFAHMMGGMNRFHHKVSNKCNDQ